MGISGEAGIDVASISIYFIDWACLSDFDVGMTVTSRWREADGGRPKNVYSVGESYREYSAGRDILE